MTLSERRLLWGLRVPRRGDEIMAQSALRRSRGGCTRRVGCVCENGAMAILLRVACSQGRARLGRACSECSKAVAHSVMWTMAGEVLATCYFLVTVSDATTSRLFSAVSLGSHLLLLTVSQHELQPRTL